VYYSAGMAAEATPSSPASRWGSPDFRLLVGGQGLSWLGDAFQPIALSVAVISSGGSATDLGLILACGILGRLGCTLIGGVWADRVRPQVIMIAADLVRAAAAVVLALLYLGEHHPLPLLCALVALFGGAGAFFFPAMSSLKPTVVAVDQRQAANATLSAVQTAALTVGPVAAGLLIAAFGAPFGFTVNAASFVASAATVALIRVRAARSDRTGFLAELRGGFAAVRSRDWLFWGIVAAGIYHVANGVILVTVNVVALRDLGGAAALGVISAAEGLGGVLGSLVAIRVRPRRPLAVGFVALGLMPIWVLSYVWPGTLTGVLLGACIGYSGLMFFSVCWDTAIQNHVPHELLARVSSWDTLTSFVGMPLGQALAGFLTDRFGTEPVLVVGAMVIFFAGVGPLAVRGTRRLTWAPTPVTSEPLSAGGTSR
jgi:predicted MFS family arabinose efflux permease